jgi:hypothetical protein
LHGDVTRALGPLGATLLKPRLSYNSAVTRSADPEKDAMDHSTDDKTFIPPRPVPPAVLDRRRRRRVLLPVAAALLAIACAGAACSSGPSTPGVAGASSGSTPTTAASNANQSGPTLTPAQRAAALAYSQCMRSHGVPNFPDPDSQGRIAIQGGPGSGLNMNSPAFQNAQKACQSKQPKPTPAQQAQALQNALRMAQCMRDHGIKDFPDPSSSGGRISLQINGSAGSDLNPNNPLFQRAQAKCMPNAPKASSGNKTSGSGGGGLNVSGGGS